MKVFEVKYKCKNCTHKFTKKHEEGTDIRHTGIIGGYAVKKGDKLFGLIDTPIRCPNCNSYKTKIKSRRKI